MSKDAVELFDEIVLPKILNFVSTLLPVFVMYSCTFSVQKLCLISDKSFGILSPDGTMDDLTSLPDRKELIVALVLIFVVVRYVIYFWLNSGQLFTRKRFVANLDSIQVQPTS